MSDSTTINSNNFKPENLHIAKYEGVIVDAICSQAFLFGETGMSKRFIRKDSIAPLCACGCGERVKKCKYRKTWNKFISGHQNRGKNHPFYDKKRPGFSGKNNPNYGKDKYKKEKVKDAPLCACGCKKPVNWCSTRSQYNEYINGHNPIGKKRPDTSKWMKKNNPMFNSESRAKLIGKNNPAKQPGVGKKIAESQMGERNSSKRPEVRRKISESLKVLGNNHPSKRLKFREFQSKRCSGKGNPNWQGGIAALPYCDIWLDKEYKQSIRDRDGNKCQNPDCWHTTDHLPLELHHIEHNKMACNPWDIITVCKSCNSRANHNMKYWEFLYQNIMAKKYGYEYTNNTPEN